MRTTQEIGLNNYARNFVRDAIKSESYKMTTGMFGEDVYGFVYEIKNKNGNIDIYREVVQDTPWSSGVMIFTCLKLEKTIRKNMPDIDWTKDDSYGTMCFQWMLNPSITDEFDYETGGYWV